LLAVMVHVENVVRAYGNSLNTRYLYLTRACQSRAKNAAIQTITRELTQSCLVLFTDDDVRFHVDTLYAYAGASAGTDGGAFYGGPVGVDYQEDPPEWLKAYLPPSAKGWWLEGGLQTFNRADFLGCNWASFVNDLQKAGGFDETFGFGGTSGGTGEETNLQGQLLKGNVKGIYVPDAKVWHYVPSERCSPIWAIRRAYLHGIEDGLCGLRMRQGLRSGSRGVISLLTKIGVEAFIKSFHGDKREAFDAYHRVSRFCGYIRGRWLARKRSATRS